VPATSVGKVLHLDEEDAEIGDLDTTISSKAVSAKEQPKVKNPIKISKNEEEKGNNNLFDGVADS
jgi:hypothetical protein